MCGIAALVSRGPVGDREIEMAAAMTRSLAHRGPDDEQLFVDGSVALGVRRLAVIDPAGGNQPLYNEDRSLVLVANGEIYNHIELRADLESRGHTFLTHSDCETILHLYEERGTRAVEALTGMFAFILYDVKQQTLFCARDRLGEKSLLYYTDGSRTLFASELKGLLASGAVPFDLDPLAVRQFLHYEYVPEPGTILRRVFKLPPGHLAIVGLEDGSMTQRPYWSLETAARVEGNPVEIIRAELERAGTLSIRSDVPVGVSLSGGLDSSLVCALAHRATGGNIQAFSVGYPGAPAGDERALARKFADSLGITWHDVEISTAEVTARFPELMRHIDEPIADICGHPYFAVAELARSKGIPVLLSGLGGDELFWGYEWLRSALARTRRKSALQGSRAALPFRFLRTLMSQRSFGGSALAEVRALRSQWRSPDTVLFYELHPDWIAGADSILTVAARTEARQEPADGFARAAIEEDLDVQFTSLVFRSYLLCNGLTQLDRLTMAASVEPRLPLLDHRLVETVVGLRKSSPDSSLPPKTWLREAAADLLPAEILERPKQPFTPPVHEWLTAIRTRYGPLLDEGYLVRSGLVDRRALRSGPGGVPLPDGLIYRALVLEVWSQENLPQPQRTPGHMTAAETL